MKNTSDPSSCPFSIPPALSIDPALGTTDSSMSWASLGRLHDNVRMTTESVTQNNAVEVK